MSMFGISILFTYSTLGPVILGGGFSRSSKIPPIGSLYGAAMILAVGISAG